MDIKKLLALFNLRDIEMVVFEKLYYGGQTTATELARQVNVSRTSIYDLLDLVIEKGLVYQTIQGTVKTFCVQSFDKIRLLIEEREREISDARHALEMFKIQEPKGKGSAVPNLQVFQGRVALQQMMKDMLLHGNSHVLSYWPIGHVAKLLTKEFFQQFHVDRMRANISVDMIWPHEESLHKTLYTHLGKEYFKNINVRIAPKGINFSLGYTIYANTVRFISSERESFGFLIQSQELTNMMRDQFKIMWEASMPARSRD